MISFIALFVAKEFLLIKVLLFPNTFQNLLISLSKLVPPFSLLPRGELQEYAMFVWMDCMQDVNVDSPRSSILTIFSHAALTPSRKNLIASDEPLSKPSVS